MRYALLSSIVLHLALFSALSLRFSLPFDRYSNQAIVVDLIKIAPQTNLPKTKPKPPKLRKKPVQKTKKPPAPRKNDTAVKEHVNQVRPQNENALKAPSQKTKSSEKKHTEQTIKNQKQRNASVLPKQKPDDIPPPVINLEERYDDIFETLDDKLAVIEAPNHSNQAYNPNLELTVNEREVIRSIIDDQLSNSWHELTGVIGADQIYVTISINVKEDCKLGKSKVLSITGAQTLAIRNSAKRRAETAITKHDRLIGLSEKQCEQVMQEQTIETTFGPDEELRDRFYGKRTL